MPIEYDTLNCLPKAVQKAGSHDRQDEFFGLLQNECL